MRILRVEPGLILPQNRCRFPTQRQPASLSHTKNPLPREMLSNFDKRTQDNDW